MPSPALLEMSAGAPAETHHDAEMDRHLVETVASFSSSFLRWMDTVGGGGPSYPMLRLVQQLVHAGPTTMRAAGEHLGLSPRNMTALVDSLEGEGLVRRRPHPTDRRAVLVEATDRGRCEAGARVDDRARAVAALFDGLAPRERRRLVELLSALDAQLGGRATVA
jgi:DNA-binding MarR family transcriptional regulator